jgi:PAS domain S-box-containing protein
MRPVRWTSYLVASAAAAIGTIARILLAPWLGDSLPYVTLFPAVALAVWWGGYRPALLCIVLSIAAAQWFIVAEGSAAGTASFVLAALIIVALGEAQRSAAREAQRSGRALQTTLASIGDAVITTDLKGTISFMNPVAEHLTGWSAADAKGSQLAAVFCIVNELTREPAEDPVQKVLAHGHAVGLANHTVLIKRDGQECAIEDSAAPIVAENGETLGVVLVFHDASARRALELQVERSERELADFFQQAILGLQSMDSRGIILRANQAQLDMLGYSHNEYVGRHIAEFHADQPTIADILARLSADEAIVDREVEMVCKDGSTRLVLLNSNVFRGPDGEFIHSRCFTQDITSQRRAEADSRRLAAIIESSDDAIMAKDLDGIVTNWNVGAERLFGYPAGEIIGKPMTRLIPPERLDEEETILGRIRRGEGASTLETVRLRKDGSAVDVSLTISPIRDAFGLVIGASTIARDITQLQQHRKELERGRAVLQEITDALPVLISLIDVTGHYRLNNRTYEEWFQVPRDMLTGRHMREVLGEEAWTIVGPRITDALAGRKVSYEAEVEYRGAGRRWINATYTPLWVDGQVIGAAVLVMDVGDRKRVERALIEADRRKDEFLATLAHELRNPLAPVRNAIETLKAETTTPARTEWARDIIDRQIRVMTRLIDDLMDVSRITQSRLILQTKRIPIRDAIEIALETSRPAIDARGAHLAVQLPAEDLYVDGDLVRLSQVFSNLLNNAAKFSHSGGAIELSVARVDDAVRVTIEDQGIGVAPDFLPKMFDLFSRGNADAHETPGLGIGLALARGIVEMHGGSIVASSSGLGSGTSLTVQLPLAQAVATAETTASADGSGGPAPRRRILVVDDYQDLAESLAELLRTLGHEVFVAFDALSGLRIAAQERPDVVFLDIGMPDIDGIEACRRIREQPWGKRMWLIALSGWSQSADRERTGNAGFDRHLVKPVDTETLELELKRSAESSGV